MIEIVMNLGIIEGRQKRALEDYIDPGYLRQRKSYDEYYVDVGSFEANWDLNDLMILAQHFKITVGPETIYIEDD